MFLRHCKFRAYSDQNSKPKLVDNRFNEDCYKTATTTNPSETKVCVKVY